MKRIFFLPQEFQLGLLKQKTGTPKQLCHLGCCKIILFLFFIFYAPDFETLPLLVLLWCYRVTITEGFFSLSVGVFSIWEKDPFD